MTIILLLTIFSQILVLMTNIYGGMFLIEIVIIWIPIERYVCMYVCMYVCIDVIGPFHMMMAILHPGFIKIKQLGQMIHAHTHTNTCSCTHIVTRAY